MNDKNIGLYTRCSRAHQEEDSPLSRDAFYKCPECSCVRFMIFRNVDILCTSCGSIIPLMRPEKERDQQRGRK